MKIIVKKGLDIPIAGKPEGSPQYIQSFDQISLNLSIFENLRFRLLVKVGDSIQIGQPLVENKALPGQMFASPAGGIISEVRRGHKRQMLDIVIHVGSQETYWEHGSLNPDSATRQEMIDLLMRGGVFPHIRQRPFNLVPSRDQVPRDIFVTALETRPFEPSQEMQIEGNEIYFQAGIKTLSKLTSGAVHLVYRENTKCSAFLQAENIATNVATHTAHGPHPAGSSSVHIHSIAPIDRSDDYVWALTALDTVVIGKMILEGRYHTDRIISIAGEGIVENKRGFFKARAGCSIKEFMTGRITHQPLQLIAGDPLTGKPAEMEDFLGFDQTCFSVIPENTTREAFHFLRLGSDKYSATRTYLSGHLPPPPEGFHFTTNQHGEERAFIDPAVYDQVMPMKIPTVFLIKAILSEDFELAEKLGLLEVIPEDFALPTFICPSKIEMIDIVKQGLHRYAQEMGQS